MNSFLVELEKNYALFNITYGEIIDFFQFPNDAHDALRYLLAQSNSRYFKNCADLGKDSHEFSKILVNKDSSGKCYLMVVGNDERTILIVRRDDSNYEDYKNVVGTKITEEQLKQEIDYIQIQRLGKLNIPPRFLRDEFLPVDICKEMDMPLLISYYQYINDYNKSTVIYNEPENTVGPAQKTNSTNPRKNPIIEWDLRQKELLKRSPQRIIRFEGAKTGSVFEAYLYERDGLTLAVVEPESGVEYQYNLNLGMVDKNDTALIEEMIQSALEAKEEIVMLDDAIMRKNHTTIEAFSENLDIFLDNAKTATKFYYDVRNAKDVYKKR